MRIIKAVTILMGILIVGGFAVLIWRMYDISSKPRATPVMQSGTPSGAPAGGQLRALPGAPPDTAARIMVPPGSNFGALSLGLPAGCEIVEVTADSGRLVLRSSCGTVFIRDLATGAPLGTIER